MLNRLTPKQEAFAQAVALQGMNQSDAYRASYNVSPDSLPSTTWEAASIVAADSKVSARITQLRATLMKQVVADATTILEKLKAIGFAAPDSSRIRPADQVAALDKMAKILGLYRDAEGDRHERPAITHVTVVLSHGGDRSERVEERVVEGTVTVRSDEKGA